MQKTKNNKRFIIGITVACILAAIGVIVFTIGSWWLSDRARHWEGEYSETTDPAMFTGRDGLLNWEEYTEYNSYLMGFPESAEDIEIEDFCYREESCGLDTTYHIYLRYTMSEEKYAMEKERLENLTLRYEGQEQTPAYIENVHKNPAYVMACEKSTIGLRTYEYVLVDDAKREIVCVFLRYAELEDTKIPTEYLLWEVPIMRQLSDDYNIYYFQHEEGYNIMWKPEASK